MPKFDFKIEGDDGYFQYIEHEAESLEKAEKDIRRMYGPRYHITYVPLTTPKATADANGEIAEIEIPIPNKSDEDLEQGVPVNTKSREG